MKYYFKFNPMDLDAVSSNHPNELPTLMGQRIEEDGTNTTELVTLTKQDHITVRPEPDGAIKEFHSPNKFFYVMKTTEETLPENQISDFLWAIGEGILESCNHPNFQYIWKLEGISWMYNLEEKGYVARLLFRILDRSKEKKTKPVGSNLYSVGDGGRRNFG